MKRLIFKFLTAIIAALLVITSLPGCQRQNKVDMNIDDDFLKVDLSKQVTLNFCFYGKSSPQDYRKVLDEIENKASANLNVKLNFRWIDYSSYQTQIVSMINSGEALDAFWCPSNYFRQFLTQNALLDITEDFKKFAPGLYSKLSKEDCSGVTDNGKLYAIPHYMPGSRRVCAVVKDDVMKKYNIPDIKDINGYEAYLKAAAENEKTLDKPVISDSLLDTFAESYGYAPIDLYLVYKWDDENMKLIPWERTEEFKLAINTFKSWKEKQYIDTSSPLNVMKGSLNTSSYLMNWDTAQSWTHGTQASYGLKVFPLYTDKISRKSSISTYNIAVSKSSANPQRVISFIEWIESSQENYDLLMYGIRDTHYKLKGEQVDLSGNSRPYCGWLGNEAFTNIDFMRPTMVDSPDYKETYKRIVTEKNAYPVTSLLISDSAGQQAMQQVAQQLQDLINKRDSNFKDFENALRAGNEPSVASFIDRQKTDGADKIVEELQKQLDDWRAKSKK